MAISRGGKEGEAVPPVPFHCEEATTGQADDKGGVSVDVKGLVWPHLDRLNSSAELSDVIR